MNSNKIAELEKILETYIDPIKNINLLKEKLLTNGFSISTKILTKSPSIISLISNKGIPNYFIKYLTSYTAHRNSHHKINLYHDDLWTIKVTSLNYDFPEFQIDGHRLIHVTKQGVNGILPKIIKYNLNKKINEIPNIHNEIFDFHIKLNITHEMYNKTSRYKYNESKLTLEEEVLKILKPSLLFQNLISNNLNNQEKELINERLKLWNVVIPFAKFKDEDYIRKTIANLNINNFGITNMITLRNINRSFSNKVSNEVMLSGELAGNFLEDKTFYQLYNLLQLIVP